ncbi:MAG: OB-fold domain-containing protein, partial [Candidatus Acidiferrales bacterium]
MIGHLRGSLLAKKPYQIVLDVGGVGYQLRVP